MARFNFNRKKFAYGAQPLLTRDVLRAKGTLDFPSVAAGASSSLTIAVPGATVGDDALLAFVSAPTAGLTFQTWVSAADTVTVRVQNVTAGAVDAASTDYPVTVLKLY